ncbi:ABC transporter permease [Billgrantia gudaonensis]|uniref:Peptide/nickel transport system permease protein n=1 Tax=Billgrantia gudaonensis TaxID=376427 RepID=A0A1G9B5Y4_9GAMM|nr:ABC transporter permease [Halomonas gudaonensis]SDK34923.1 peptide/nickel transport system permease protein [Halomonas gudaonensis]
MTVIAAHASRATAAWRDSDLSFRLAVIAGLVLLTVAALAPWLAPFDPDQQTLLARLSPPIGFEGAKAGHWLGTDELGRDILSRGLHALRITLGIGMAGASLGMLLGLTLGLIAGLKGGLVDDLVAGAIDIQIALPFTLLALLAVAIFGGDLTVLIVVLGIAGWETFARVVRGEVMKLRGQPFIEAALAAGASPWRIATRHLLPNLVSPLVVMFALSFSQIVLLESTLSFLGLGVRPPTATLGSMVGQGRDYMPSAPWLVIVPSLLVLLVTLVVQLLGDSLRDRTDIRLRQR